MIRNMRAITTALLSLSPLALASNEYSPQFGACMNKAEGVTSAMVECYNEELEKEDARLNNAYKNVMTAFSPENKQKVLTAQRLWIKFRDADCNLYYTLSGGTMDLLNGADCTLSMTKKRADDLVWLSRNGGE